MQHSDRDQRSEAGVADDGVSRKCMAHIAQVHIGLSARRLLRNRTIDEHVSHQQRHEWESEFTDAGDLGPKVATEEAFLLRAILVIAVACGVQVAPDNAEGEAGEDVCEERKGNKEGLGRETLVVGARE